MLPSTAEHQSEETRPRSVDELITESFFIPFYQRGYKWTKAEVDLLLTDIRTHPAGQDYCLQPIVIAKRGESWEVIDGQQRLTTIHLILKFLGRPSLRMEYARRSEDEQTFVDLIPTADTGLSHLDWQGYLRTVPDKDLNTIDNFHLFHAWRAIHEYFTKSESSSIESFEERLLNKVTIIWHVVAPQNASKEFTNFNDGRILLSPCELLKAIFLSNPSTGNEIRSSEEIAFEWDQMESAFHNEEFWNFLNPPQSVRNAPNRVSLLFQMIDGEKAKDDAAGSAFFRRITGEIDRANPVMEWMKLRRCFLSLQEWFEDREIYHSIGFLRWCKRKKDNHSLRDLSNFSRENSRENFRRYIAELIRRMFFSDGEDFASYRYDEPSHKNKIQDLLLWFNIKELSCHYRYPFSRHALVKQWSLEHLYPQSPLEKMEATRIEGWITSAARALDKEEDGAAIKEQLAKIPKTEKGVGENRDLIEKVSKLVGYDFNRNTHELANMALIDSRDNSALGNGFFDAKRKRILEFETKIDHFIPPSTSKIFLKYYEGNTNSMSEWTPEDRDGYLARISKVMRETAEMETI